MLYCNRKILKNNFLQNPKKRLTKERMFDKILPLKKKGTELC